MHSTIAQRDLGICPICFGRLEAGDWITISSMKGTVHSGCLSLRRDNIAVDEEIGPLFGAQEERTIEHAKQILGVTHISFDGASALGIDQPRLAGQLAKVFELMRDGHYRTLAQVAFATGCLETSASARLRDLRKARFGSHTVISRHSDGSPGTYEYRLILNTERGTDEKRDAA